MGAGHLAHSPEQRQRVTLEGILRVFGLAKSDFDFVIVDLGFVNAAGLERGRFQVVVNRARQNGDGTIAKHERSLGHSEFHLRRAATGRWRRGY